MLQSGKAFNIFSITSSATSQSPELMNCTYSPCAIRIPLFIAWYMPPSYSDTQYAIFSENCFIKSTLPSVDPPSIIMYSKSLLVCDITLLIVFSNPNLLFRLIVIIECRIRSLINLFFNIE